MKRAAAFVASLLLSGWLAACQTTPAAEATTGETFGGWTVTTSGRVVVEAGVGH